MSMIPAATLESVGCPRCGAGPGVPCTIRRPGSGPVHLARSDRYLRETGAAAREANR
jgi:hypothetical protein